MPASLTVQLERDQFALYLYMGVALRGSGRVRGVLRLLSRGADRPGTLLGARINMCRWDHAGSSAGARLARVTRSHYVNSLALAEVFEFGAGPP